MRVNDLVRIRILRDRQWAYGVLVEMDLAKGTGVVLRDGKRYVRSLKRIYGKVPSKKELRRLNKQPARSCFRAWGGDRQWQRRPEATNGA